MILLSGSKFIIIKVLAILEYKIQVQWWVLLGNVFVRHFGSRKISRHLAINSGNIMWTIHANTIHISSKFSLCLQIVYGKNKRNNSADDCNLIIPLFMIFLNVWMNYA